MACTIQARKIYKVQAVVRVFSYDATMCISTTATQPDNCGCTIFRDLWNWIMGIFSSIQYGIDGLANCIEYVFVWVYEHIEGLSATIIHSVTQLCICQSLIMVAEAHHISSNRPSLSLADFAIAHLRGTHPTACDARYFRTSRTIHPILFRIAPAWVWRFPVALVLES
ncbi:hypothetical protein BDN71DRAFT_1450038 [Pleurotus eryngii]|uniref:Uncharacterized protein n=1 Tax=Pleurotus eryngii TaxID=5323 RepID=A0A9P5ZTV7_PLEER|nr:hypothetical protein BDN71DRAFT_1450038 [Pleurotus eryngii]